MEEAVILSAVRTPVGTFLGSLKDVRSPWLGAHTIREAIARAGVPGDHIDECLMGCVLPAGLGQAPARQAAIYGGLPHSVRCTTVNRVCGSGLKTVMLGAQAIQLGDASLVVAGGMESMSRAPYVVEKAREGLKFGHGKLVDTMIQDGLWDAYGDVHMGSCAELCATEGKYSRADQDRYAEQSYRRAQQAILDGKFRDEIVGIDVVQGKETRRFDTDEQPAKARFGKFGDVRPAFDPKGSVTAANSSSLNDGAAAFVLASARIAKERALRPIARIVAQASHAQAPEWFTTAPVGAVQKLLKKAGMKAADIDLFEINEAFAVVALACNAQLGLSEEKVNVRGGAVALGHPIGASGARILTTLVHALRREKKRYGVAAICIGGGEASAVLIEAL